LQYCRTGAETEVFSQQDPIISPTMLMIVMLKESNLKKALVLFHVKCNEPSNRASLSLDKKRFQRLWSHPIFS